MQDSHPNPSKQGNDKSDDATIFVNGSPHPWPKNTMISYAQVVALDPDYAQHPEINYTVKYSPNENAEASFILPPGDSTKVHDKMIFNVRDTGQS